MATWWSSARGSSLLRSSADARFLERALRLAARGRYRTAPNPMVGAVVVREGAVVGEGYHRRVGGPHAEVEALAAAGEAARGATLYVTLEPCNHEGRTPPCTEAILGAGISRVVLCHRDPHRAVEGGGVERLRAAGLGVSTGELAEEAVRLNLSYLVPHLLGRPAVTLKWAMSLDGRIATAAGESKWISAPRARRWALELREEHDAVLVGVGTLLADDPRLDRRLGRAGAPNLRVGLDRRLRTPASARFLELPGDVLLYTESAEADRRGPLEERGATVVRLEEVSPAGVLADLVGRGVQSLLVEGGAAVLGSFVASGAFERVEAVCAPLLVGGAEAPGPVGDPGAQRLAEAVRLDGLRVGRRGGDVILKGLRESCLRELSASVAG